MELWRDLGGWALSWCECTGQCSFLHRLQVSPHRESICSFPKPALEAGAYLGGGGSKPVLQAGSQALPWKQVLWWPPGDQGLGWLVLSRM